MKNSTGNKKILKLIYFILLLIIVAYLFFNDYGIIKYMKIKSEVKELEREIDSSETKLKAIDAEIDSLKYDDMKIEKVARERYHMMKKNEKVLEVEEK